MFIKKIFIGCIDYAYMWGDISIELRRKGIDVSYLGGYSHKAFMYKHQIQGNGIISLIERCYDLRNTTGRLQIKNFPLKVIAILGIHSLKVILFITLLTQKTDAYVFVGGSSLLPSNIDLYILKIFGIPTISYIAHGGDSRPPYLDGTMLPDLRSSISDDILKQVLYATKLVSKRVSRTLWTKYIICNPFHSQFVPKPFYSSFDFLDCAAFSPLEHSEDTTQQGAIYTKDCEYSINRPLNLLHTYSWAPRKGSDEIEKAVNNLIKKGYPINFQIKSGLPHAEVVALRAEADLFIDQLYSDTPLSSSATEALSVGVPVIVGGYEMLNLPSVKTDILPGFFIKPDQLEETLIRIIENPFLIKEQHEKIRIFNSVNHIGKGAIHIIDLLEGRSKFKTHDPSDLTFHHGIGVNENNLRFFLQKYINKYGIKGMLVSENSRFIQSIKKFIKNAN